jgi:hypothetical protein
MSQDRLSKLTKAQLIARVEELEQRCKVDVQQSQFGPQISKFRDEIESLTGWIAYFDKDDRMVFCNENFRLARPGMEDFYSARHALYRLSPRTPKERCDRRRPGP